MIRIPNKTKKISWINDYKQEDWKHKNRFKNGQSLRQYTHSQLMVYTFKSASCTSASLPNNNKIDHLILLRFLTNIVTLFFNDLRKLRCRCFDIKKYHQKRSQLHIFCIIIKLFHVPQSLSSHLWFFHWSRLQLQHHIA